MCTSWAFIAPSFHTALDNNSVPVPLQSTWVSKLPDSQGSEGLGLLLFLRVRMHLHSTSPSPGLGFPCLNEMIQSPGLPILIFCHSTPFTTIPFPKVLCTWRVRTWEENIWSEIIKSSFQDWIKKCKEPLELTQVGSEEHPTSFTKAEVISPNAWDIHSLKNQRRGLKGSSDQTFLYRQCHQLQETHWAPLWSQYS